MTNTKTDPLLAPGRQTRNSRLCDAPGPSASCAADAGWWKPDLFPFTSRFCDLPTGRVHYVDEGSGPVLLFLPPAPLWSFMYRRFIAGLSDRFRCVALDFPGFGPSPAPTGFRVDLDAMSATVQHLVDALALRHITIVGHDSGGIIGLHAAGRRPETVAALVVADTFGFALDRFSPIRAALRIVSSGACGRVQERFNLLVRLITTVGVRRRKFTASERAAFLLAYPDRVTRRRPLEVFRALADRDDFLRETERGMERLRHKPVLSMFGQFDPVRLLGYQRKFAATFPRHRGLVIRGEGHFPTEGAPEEMIAAIRIWWDEELGGTRPS